MPKTIHSGERKIVHNVLKYLSVRKAEGLATISVDNITDLVVNMTGLSLETTYVTSGMKIIKRGNISRPHGVCSRHSLDQNQLDDDYLRKTMSTDTTFRPCCCRVMSQVDIRSSIENNAKRVRSVASEIINPIIADQGVQQGWSTESSKNTLASRLQCQSSSLETIKTANGSLSVYDIRMGERAQRISVPQFADMKQQSSSLIDVMDIGFKTCDACIKSGIDKMNKLVSQIPQSQRIPVPQFAEIKQQTSSMMDVINTNCKTCDACSKVAPTQRIPVPRNADIEPQTIEIDISLETCDACSKGKVAPAQPQQIPLLQISPSSTRCIASQYSPCEEIQTGIPPRPMCSRIDRNKKKRKKNKKAKNVICECPPPDPVPFHYEIDAETLPDRHTRSEQTQTVSGFKFKVKKRILQSDKSYDRLLEAALMKMLEYENLWANKDPCVPCDPSGYCDEDVKLSEPPKKIKKAVVCQCPPKTSNPGTSDLQAKTEDDHIPGGIKFQIPAKGSGSKGLSGVLCFE